MHGDEMAVARYQGRTISWGIRIGGRHAWSAGWLVIDVRQLYDDLRQLLESEADAAEGVHVWLRDSFRFNTGFARATRDEALRLGVKEEV
jgi:hypothetical protein